MKIATNVPEECVWTMRYLTHHCSDVWKVWQLWKCGAVHGDR